MDRENFTRSTVAALCQSPAGTVTSFRTRVRTPLRSKSSGTHANNPHSSAPSQFDPRYLRPIGLKEARSSALKLEIRLERRAREIGGGGVWCMPQGIGLAACFCCFLPPIGWPLFRNLAEISRNDHCWPPPQRRWPRSSCSCTPVHTRLTSPCAFEIAVARFPPRQYLVQ